MIVQKEFLNYWLEIFFLCAIQLGWFIRLCSSHSLKNLNFILVHQLFEEVCSVARTWLAQALALQFLVDPIDVIDDACVNSWERFSSTSWINQEMSKWWKFIISLWIRYLFPMRQYQRLPWSQLALLWPLGHQSLLDSWDVETVSIKLKWQERIQLPITLSFGISTAHHVGCDSCWAITSHQTFILWPDWNNDGSECLRCWRSFWKAAPTGNKRQLVSKIDLMTVGQAGWRNSGTVKHWRFQL